MLFACARINTAGDLRSELPTSCVKTVFHEIYHIDKRMTAEVSLCHANAC